MPQSLTKQITINALPAEAYRALTNERALCEWLCDFAISNPFEGGAIYLGWEDGYFAAGTFEKLEEDKSIRFTWRSPQDSAPTVVEVQLRAQGNSTQIVIEHSGFDSEETAAQLDRPWDIALECLAENYAGGENLRLARRPMLGILLGPLMDAKRAQELNCPVGKGVLLDGTIEGLSAANAGMVRGDVVHSINSIVLDDYSAFGPALDGKLPGDVVEVVFYRGTEKHESKMPLSPRKLTAIPPSPGALADQAAAIYASGQAELARWLDGLTDAQLDHIPAEGEWSVRQIIGHLICNERDNHTRISLAVGGWREPWSFYNNSLLRILPILETFTTLPALIDELKRCEAQTVAGLRHLPDEFVARRGSYVRLGREILDEGSDHPARHIEQIKAALAAVSA